MLDFLGLAVGFLAFRLVLAAVALVGLLAVFNVLDLTLNRKKNLMHLPGPTPLPLIGNALLFSGPHENFMPAVRKLVADYGPVLRMHLGTRPNVVVSSAESYQKILSSNIHITKGRDYKFLSDWLGQGLLTSTGSLWHSRRKLLTPAFHFKILEDFLMVMNTQSEILCNILKRKVEETSADDPWSKTFDIFPYITHCALDIICETAMGRSVNAQEDSDSEYVKAVYLGSDIVHRRQMSPWLWSDSIFAMTPLGKQWRDGLSVLHGFTNKIIKEKKAELESSEKSSSSADEDVDLLTGRRKKTAFLDLLLKEAKGGTVLSDRDIREEVDTFMFEGHDTTATSMTFTLYLMASHPEIQAKVQAELDEIFQEEDKDGATRDLGRPATSVDLSKMKYLELCLKESLRLFQSVPIISRTLGEPLELDGQIIPANTNVIMANFILHRDPELFKEPNKFIPERFEQDAMKGINAYGYVPFSAGPRNCIGQKFAMMEEKVVISTVLRNFNLKTSMKIEDIPLLAEVILRPQNGIHIQLEKRL